VLVGGLQTTVETMMQTGTPDAVSDWLRTTRLAAVRAVEITLAGCGPGFRHGRAGTLFEFNEGDEIVYFGRGKDRAKESETIAGHLNGAASGAGAYQVLVENSREVGGYFVRWLS